MRIRSTKRAAAAVAFSASLVLMLAAPASATIYSNGQYGDSYSFSYDCGDAPIDVSGSFGGREIIRTGTGAQVNAFFDHNQYWWTETHKNRTTGTTISISANGVFQETKATRVDGSIFLFSSVDAGQPFVVRDAAGHVLLRDRGAIKETILFDTTGDGVPGGIFIESVSLSVAGPHPGFFFDPCSVLG
jgi:hypothetical protein